MSLVKEIGDMKNSGKSDSQIVGELRMQGFMPKDIEEGLSQFQVKNAVSQEYGIDSSMQRSIMSSPDVPVPSPSNQPAPQPDMYSVAPGYDHEQQQQGYSNYAPYQAEEQQQMPQQQYYAPAANSETMSEIAEQIFDQKTGKLKNELSKIEDFRLETENKINLMRERIKRVEGIIDSLQDSIIKKIGEYGENIQDLGKDLRMTQDSFSKVVSPAVSRAKSRRGASRKTSKKKSAKSVSKKK